MTHFSTRKTSQNVCLYFSTWQNNNESPSQRVPVVTSIDPVESSHGHRHLQGGPKVAELSLTYDPDTDGSEIKGAATFFQGGDRSIRLFTADCATPFSPSLTFDVVGGATNPQNDTYTYDEKGPAQSTVEFNIKLASLDDHLLDDADATTAGTGTANNVLDGGKVTVCVQLETVNTLQNYVRTITIDLTHSATATANAAQPSANVTALNIDTKLDAWVCDYNSEAVVGSVTVPGMIYVCIQCTDGYQIQEGTLSADSAYTAATVDEEYNDYMVTGTPQTTGTLVALTKATPDTWSGTPTLEVLANNKVRVSVQGLSTWAATATTSTPASSFLTITVTAQFDPVRRLATVAAYSSDETANNNRHLRQRDDEIIVYAQDSEGADEEEDSQYHWGRVRPDGGKAAREKPKLKTSIFAESAMEFAQATTTVLIHGPSPVDSNLGVPIVGVIAGTILLCLSCCCFFLGACWRRRRDDDEEEEQEKDFPDGKSIESADTYTENDMSSRNSGGGLRAPPMASVYGGRAA